MWNAQLYDTFNKERIQPSIDLVNRIDKVWFGTSKSGLREWGFARCVCCLK